MPQAVNTYLDTNNLSSVDQVKRNIIELYQDDFLKLDPTGRVGRLFMQIPSQLSGNKNRYTPSQVIGNVAENKMEVMLRDLEDSKTVNLSYHASDPNVGLSLAADMSRYKIYCGDTGLFVTLAFWDKDYTENVIYQKLLGDKLEVNLGYVYENLVAQMFTAAGNKLFYYTWKKDERHRYEIDFLLSKGARLCPVEVKSSGYNAHKSLDAFCTKYSSRVGDRYLLYTKDLRKDGETLLVPMYMTPLL